jgi:hypothetical protein
MLFLTTRSGLMVAMLWLWLTPIIRACLHLKREAGLIRKCENAACARGQSSAFNCVQLCELISNV